jgi:hypothetical protein
MFNLEGGLRKSVCFRPVQIEHITSAYALTALQTINPLRQARVSPVARDGHWPRIMITVHQNG